MFNLAVLLELLLLGSRLGENLQMTEMINTGCLIVNLSTMIMYTMMMVNTVTILEIALIGFSSLINS